jgi:4-amino-4-deoxy-L-arabinose transferase-like glycosyltransferase
MTPDPHRTWHEWIALGALLVAALAIRIPLINQLPLEFASMRQYHSALIARAIYFRMDPAAGPQWRMDAANDYVVQATIPEPLIVERIAAAGYLLAGGERLWMPRGLSAVYWFIGALFLYGAGRRLSGPGGGLTTAAVYLFLPYAIDASLSVQPDILAVMWMCASLYALARYADRPATGPLLAAVALAMPAILVRPMTACFLFPVMLALVWRDAANPVGARVKRIAACLVVSAAPAALYFALRFLMDPTLAARANATFVPGLFLEPAFWRGWARFAWLAFGPVLLLGALAGALIVARGRTRAMLVSLWVGYALYGAAFNLHISTHPYYQTLAVPMVALSLAALVAAAARSGRRWTTLVAAAVVAALLIISGARQGILTRHPDAQRIQDYEAVGRATGHSRQVIFLTDNWGAPLRYHGDIAGRYWPTRFEIDMYRPLGSSGIPDVTASARLDELGRQIGGAAYFAVTDLTEFARQPDLRTFLDSNYTVVERTGRYVIYSLKGRLG